MMGVLNPQVPDRLLAAAPINPPTINTIGTIGSTYHFSVRDLARVMVAHIPTTR